MSKEWQYTDDWSENDMLDGRYCGYVYLFQFEDGSVYLGSKQIYKRIKDAKNLKVTKLRMDGESTQVVVKQ